MQEPKGLESQLDKIVLSNLKRHVNLPKYLRYDEKFSVGPQQRGGTVGLGIDGGEGCQTRRDAENKLNGYK